MVKTRSLLIPLAVLLLATLACGSISPDQVVQTVVVTEEVVNDVIVTATPEPEPPPPQPIFTEDFENGPGDWTVGGTDSSTATVENGQLVIDVLQADWVRTVSHPALDRLETYAIDFDMTYTDGAEDSEGGLAFRCESDDPSSEWLELSFAQDGYVTMASIPVDDTANSVNYHIAFTPTDLLNTGQATNHIRVLDDLTTVTIYVNDQLLALVPYDQADPGCPALLAGTFDGGPGTWAFDNVMVYNLDDIVGP
jgi:hypothetical protein